jgi:hypothetical protein
VTDISKAEAALINAKANCFKVCGKLGPEAHEAHRVELERAYQAFQEASGESEGSNPASGKTQIKANLTVQSGLK